MQQDKQEKFSFDSPSQTQNRQIEVYFKINYWTELGKSIYIIGNTQQLGNWNPLEAIKLQWNIDHYWTTMISFSRYQNEQVQIEYKFLLNNTNLNQNCNHPIWEPGPNRIIPQYTLQQCPKQEYFLNEIWGYRSIKLKLNHTINTNKFQMYVIGTSPSLGNFQTPMKMQKSVKQDLVNGQETQQWSYIVNVDPQFFYFRYFYVMKNEMDGTMIWERGQGRQFSSQQLFNCQSVQEEYCLSPIMEKTKLYSYYAVKKSKQNGTFYSESTIQQKKNSLNKEQKQLNGYTYKDGKNYQFFFYEAFGRIHKLDWNFVLTFSYNQINENIIIGPYPQNEEDFQKLKKEGVKAVLNLQTKFDMHHRGLKIQEIIEIYQKLQIDFVNYEIWDMNPKDFIKRGAKASQILKKLINAHELVYVHCTAGIGRAPSTVILYLCTTLAYNLDDAIVFIKKKRPNVYIHYDMLAKSLNQAHILNGHLDLMEQQL